PDRIAQERLSSEREVVTRCPGQPQFLVAEYELQRPHGLRRQLAGNGQPPTGPHDLDQSRKGRAEVEHHAGAKSHPVLEHGMRDHVQDVAHRWATHAGDEKLGMVESVEADRVAVGRRWSIAVNGLDPHTLRSDDPLDVLPLPHGVNPGRLLAAAPVAQWSVWR